jgi:beta-lactamase class D
MGSGCGNRRQGCNVPKTEITLVRLFILVAAAFLASLAFAGAPDQSMDRKADPVTEIFSSNGVDGTLVVASADGEILHLHNDKRSVTRFSPASTFKIANTLIALDLRVIESSDDSFSWDGVDRGLTAWNKDQTLLSAFRVSCVWCYQEIARKVGLVQYETALNRIGYGNQRVGDQVDQFWLNGVLRISAVEQISFLKSLLGGSVPYQREHIGIVKEVMREEQGADYVLYAKSGWTGSEQHVGWYVGFLEKADGIWLFAMNMRMDEATEAPLRKELTVESLRALGILE